MRHIRLIAILGLVALLGLAAGCSPSSINSTSAGVPVATTTGTPGITLVANPMAVSTFGLTSITATVVDPSGSLASGATVSFSLTNGTHGVLNTNIATTTASGTASVTFTANGNAGTETITAVVTVSGTTYINSVNVTISSQTSPAALSLSANPTSVFVNGTSTITARVVDASGNSIADNTPVAFSLSDPLKASITPSAVTSGGYAIATFTANSPTNTTVDVTATAGTKTAKITLTITGGLAGGSVTVSAAPATLIANGFSTSTITATVLDNSLNPVPGATVTFSLNNLNATLSPASAVTNASGVATVTLTSTVQIVNVSVTVTATTLSLTGSTTVSLNAPSGSGSMTVAAIPSSIITNSSSVIKATLLDNLGAPAIGVTVTFSLSAPSATLSSLTAVTDGTGVASVTLTSGSIATTIIVTASSVAPALSGQATITITPAPPASVNVAANPTSITVLGTSTITATVKDANGNPVPDGTSVTFSLNPATTFGKLSSPVTSTANGNGTATTTIVASDVAGTVTITATAGSVSSTTSLTVIPAATGSIQFLSAVPQLIGIQGSGQPATSLVTFMVKDINGNPATDGTAVGFSLLGPGGGEYIGNVDATPKTASGSTVSGKASVFLNSGTVAGPCTIIASTSINSGNLTTLSAPLVSEPTTTSILVSSTSGFPPTGRIKIDSELIKYAGLTGTSFTGCTRGDFGTAVAAHSSGAQVFGQNTISSSATEVSIGGGVPSASHWSLAASIINLQGLKYVNKQSTISSYMADRFGNYNILNGTAVSFYAEAGAIDTQGITDATGATSVIFRTQAPMPADVKNTVSLDGDHADFAAYFGIGNEPWLPVPTLNANPRDGWVTVLATTLGEEAFVDENGDGMFTRSYCDSTGHTPAGKTCQTACPPGHTCECDGGTPNAYAGCITSQRNGSSFCSPVATCAAGPGGLRSEGFIDQGEPFYDKNDNGKRDDGSVSGYPFEEFIDANRNGVYDGPNGMWDGPGCQSPGLCEQLKLIWMDMRLVFSGDANFYPLPDVNNCYSLSGGCSATWGAGGTAIGFAIAPLSISRGGSGSFMVIVGDENLNRMGPGTTISARADEGSVTGVATYTVPDGLSTGPTLFSFGVAISPTSTKTQTNITVTVTAPDGIQTNAVVGVPII